MYTISTCISQISVRETYHVMHWVEINSVDSVTQNARYFLQDCTVHEKKISGDKTLTNNKLT